MKSGPDQRPLHENRPQKIRQTGETIQTGALRPRPGEQRNRMPQKAAGIATIRARWEPKASQTAQKGLRAYAINSIL